MVDKEDDYYYLLQRKEVDSTILTNKPWWDTYIQELETEEEYKWQEEKEEKEQPEFSEYQARPSIPIEEEPNMKEYMNRNKQE